MYSDFIIVQSEFFQLQHFLPLTWRCDNMEVAQSIWGLENNWLLRYSNVVTTTHPRQEKKDSKASATLKECSALTGGRERFWILYLDEVLYFSRRKKYIYVCVWRGMSALCFCFIWLGRIVSYILVGQRGESLGITIHFRSLIDKRCCLCREVKTCVTSTWQPVANYVDGRGRRLGKSILVLVVAVGLVIGADIFH